MRRGARDGFGESILKGVSLEGVEEGELGKSCQAKENRNSFPMRPSGNGRGDGQQSRRLTTRGLLMKEEKFSPVTRKGIRPTSRKREMPFLRRKTPYRKNITAIIPGMRRQETGHRRLRMSRVPERKLCFSYTQTTEAKLVEVSCGKTASRGEGEGQRVLVVAEREGIRT